jgi:hypothetical protein
MVCPDGSIQLTIAEWDALLAERDLLRERLADGHRLLLKMCAAQDLMPDDVAVWLGYTDHYARAHPSAPTARTVCSLPGFSQPGSRCVHYPACCCGRDDGAVQRQGDAHG